MKVGDTVTFKALVIRRSKDDPMKAAMRGTVIDLHEDGLTVLVDTNGTWYGFKGKTVVTLPIAVLQIISKQHGT